MAGLSGPGNYQYVKVNNGLIGTFTYDPGGGYLTSEKIQKGQS